MPQLPDGDTLGTVLRLHPLTYLDDRGEVVIGRVDIDSYGVFPPDGAGLVRQLAGGATPREAARWFAETYDEPVDIEGFLDVLTDLDFIDTADFTATGTAAAESVANSPKVQTDSLAGRQVRWQRAGTALFSWPAWVVYAAIMVATVTVAAADQRFVPHLDQLFFSQYLLVIEVTIGLAQTPLLLIHEVFHALAGRRLGLNSRIRLSRRLYFVVFETVLDGLVAVPRRQRYLPMLAGMLADLLLICLLTLTAWLLRGDGGQLTLASGVLLALAFAVMPRMVMQFFFFLRTDIYYLVVTVCGCVDLHGTATAMVANQFWRALRHPDRMVDPDRWHPRDVQVGRWYAPLVVVGYLVAFGLLALVLLPITWRFMSSAVATAWGGQVGSVRFWDAAGLLALNVVQPAIAAGMKLREKRTSRVPGQAPPPIR